MVGRNNGNITQILSVTSRAQIHTPVHNNNGLHLTCSTVVYTARCHQHRSRVDRGSDAEFAQRRPLRCACHHRCWCALWAVAMKLGSSLHSAGPPCSLSGGCRDTSVRTLAILGPSRAAEYVSEQARTILRVSTQRSFKTHKCVCSFLLLLLPVKDPSAQLETAVGTFRSPSNRSSKGGARPRRCMPKGEQESTLS